MILLINFFFLRKQLSSLYHHKVKVMQPDAAGVDKLKIFPFLDSMVILDQLKDELPVYLVKSADIDINMSCMEWWELNKSALPGLSAAAYKVFLIQPSSAASERAFSLLNSSFNDQQYQSLQDYVEASIMLQYNRKNSE